MPFNIVIVGTGIAGLGAAVALSNKGHNVTMVEATAQLQPIGGIMVLQANANRVLDSWGVYKTLLDVCTPLQIGPSTKTYKFGDSLIQKPAEAHEKEYGYKLLPLHRADLQQVLYKAAMNQKITLRLGCAIVGLVEDDETLAVVTKNGERIEADVIVGADGIKSTVRNSIIPDFPCVRDSGMDITRANIPGAIIRQDPQTSIFMDQIGLWCGPSATLAVMPVRRGMRKLHGSIPVSMLNTFLEDGWLLGLDCCHRRGETSVEGTSRKQSIEQLKEYFQDFAPAIQKMLSYVKEAHVWRLMETMPPSWVSKSGRIVLIGDAAHAALPWVGQGGGMALEDAATLAECLERVEVSEEIPKALRAFQEIREPRCKRVQTWSAIKGKRATVPDGPEQEQRDSNFKQFNAWVKAEPWDRVHVDEPPEIESPNWKAWLKGHNAVDFANRELDKRFGGRH